MPIHKVLYTHIYVPPQPFLKALWEHFCHSWCFTVCWWDRFQLTASRQQKLQNPLHNQSHCTFVNTFLAFRLLKLIQICLTYRLTYLQPRNYLANYYRLFQFEWGSTPAFNQSHCSARSAQRGPAGVGPPQQAPGAGRRPEPAPCRPAAAGQAPWKRLV